MIAVERSVSESISARYVNPLNFSEYSVRTVSTHGHVPRMTKVVPERITPFVQTFVHPRRSVPLITCRPRSCDGDQKPRNLSGSSQHDRPRLMKNGLETRATRLSPPLRWVVALIFIIPAQPVEADGIPAPEGQYAQPGSSGFASSLTPPAGEMPPAYAAPGGSTQVPRGSAAWEPTSPAAELTQLSQRELNCAANGFSRDRLSTRHRCSLPQRGPNSHSRSGLQRIRGCPAPTRGDQSSERFARGVPSVN